MLDKDRAITPATLLRDARKKLVQKYLEHPGSFPDGIEDKKAEPWYSSNKDYWHKLAKDEEQADSEAPPKTDSPSTDSPHNDSLGQEENALHLLAAGNSIRDVAGMTGLSIGKVQRIKAKLV